MPSTRSLALLSLAVAAAGQELIKIMSSAQMGLLFVALDGDGDGAVPFDEGSVFVRSLSTAPIRGQAGRVLSHMDADADGRLSAEEFAEDLGHTSLAADRQADLVRRFGGFDDDGDGAVSLDEALPLFNYMFAFHRLDADADGWLTLEEFMEIAAPKLQHVAPHHVEKSVAEGRAIFQELDGDGDGRLDAREHFLYESGIYAGQVAWRALYEMADVDGDGRISKEELVACRENPKFGGSAAYHHSKTWIAAIEDMFKQAGKASDEL